ncbi:MAG: hypothetical protein H7201_10360 [Candidatus Saccharibacteria bacterium]|nr:hypothetical protein [Microbacteriaceae bacterium]
MQAVVATLGSSGSNCSRCLASDPFRRLWARHDIHVRAGGEAVVRHPELGELSLRREKLTIGGYPWPTPRQLSRRARLREGGSARADFRDPGRVASVSAGAVGGSVVHGQPCSLSHARTPLACPGEFAIFEHGLFRDQEARGG